ncbi:hypothetical protein ACFSYD_03735 [Paracoccus aerius]
MAEPVFRGLYALPPGIDFAHEFVAGFLDRMAGQPPEAMARVTIYGNASRTLAELQCAFDLRGPLLLPRLLPVTNLEAPGMLDHAEASPLARRLQLARLVAGLLKTRPDLASGHSIAALARSLSTLMHEMQTEGLGPDALEGIDTGDHARHWQNALGFLRIAARFHLEGPPTDRAARQRLASQILCEDWSKGQNLPDGPVIIVGSTGSHGATRLFMEAVAQLPEGAVVLPGFDFDQPQTVWDGLDHRTEDHPQARFAPLIRKLGRPARWTDTPPPAPARNRLVSLALRPAPVTDQWIAEGPRLPDLIAPTQGLTLIEADQPGQEAEVIALILRDAAERHASATLVAADGNLIRRVNAALDRWRLCPDESAGQPLSLTGHGLFLRHIAALFGEALSIDRLLILLKHPLGLTGSPLVGANDARRLARDLELELRRNGPAFPDGECLRTWGSKGTRCARPGRNGWLTGWTGSRRWRRTGRRAPLRSPARPDRPGGRHCRRPRRKCRGLEAVAGPCRIASAIHDGSSGRTCGARAGSGSAGFLRPADGRVAAAIRPGRGGRPLPAHPRPARGADRGPGHRDPVGPERGRLAPAAQARSLAVAADAAGGRAATAGTPDRLGGT